MMVTANQRIGFSESELRVGHGPLRRNLCALLHTRRALNLCALLDLRGVVLANRRNKAQVKNRNDRNDRNVSAYCGPRCLSARRFGSAPGQCPTTTGFSNSRWP